MKENGGLPKKRKKGDMRDSLEKGKYLANSYNAATVNVNCKLSSFFQCYFKSGTEILMTVWDFFPRNHFLRGDFIFPWMGGHIFSRGFIFRWRGHPKGVSSALMEGGKKIYGVRGTPIMALPTRANSGLCCNRIKKKHEVQYALENSHEKDLDFMIKSPSSQINF